MPRGRLLVHQSGDFVQRTYTNMYRSSSWGGSNSTFSEFLVRFNTLLFDTIYHVIFYCRSAYLYFTSNKSRVLVIQHAYHSNTYANSRKPWLDRRHCFVHRWYVTGSELAM